MADTAIREFAMSFADLVGTCNTIYNCMERDASEFLGYGVTATKLSDYRDAIDDFVDLPSDSEMSSNVVLATEQKNEAANDLRIMLRSFNTRAKVVFGDTPGKYDRFNVKELSRLNENDLKAFAEKVIRSSELYLTELSAAGVTQALIDELDGLLTAYKAACDKQEDEIMDRDAASNNRVKMANDLYKLLINYCEIGKTIWYETNEAKYNDYIIYTGTSPGSLAAPQNFMFDPVNYDFSWSAVTNATSYILQESTDGINWTQYWAGHETTCSYEESPTTIMYFRVLAHNSGGNSAPSDTLNYDFAPPLVAPSNFNYDSVTYYFTWNAVPNAEYYEFQYRAQTNPTWNSLNAGSATSFYHADPPGDYVARVRGAAGTTFGPWSNEEEYSVGAP